MCETSSSKLFLLLVQLLGGLPRLHDTLQSPPCLEATMSPLIPALHTIPNLYEPLICACTTKFELTALQLSRTVNDSTGNLTK